MDENMGKQWNGLQATIRRLFWFSNPNVGLMPKNTLGSLRRHHLAHTIFCCFLVNVQSALLRIFIVDVIVLCSYCVYINNYPRVSSFLRVAWLFPCQQEKKESVANKVHEFRQPRERKGTNHYWSVCTYCTRRGIYVLRRAEYCGMLVGWRRRE